MSIFKPIIFKDYKPAKLHEGKIWYIDFYVKAPDSRKLKRQRIKFNRGDSIAARRKEANIIVGQINEHLALGWNPMLEKSGIYGHNSAYKVMDNFLRAKEKESEFHTIRCYKSFVKIFKEWLSERGVNDSTPISSITPAVAIKFMEDIEILHCAQTYNNYLRFFIIMFNWMKERSHIDINPFEGIKRKSKKLTKKKRRVLTDDELSRLIAFLETENSNYLLICLLCYYCLIRPKEISMLKCKDIDISRHTVRISEDIAKNDNTSFRTIPDQLMKRLAKVNLKNGDYYLFSGKDFTPGKERIWSQKISDYWGQVVRPGCNFDSEVQFYSLKDTGITNMIASGIPVSFVQQQADHSSLAITSIYVGKTNKASEEIRKFGEPHP
ncbi:MAG: tyrosine-type recombinase/integrase [Candidatus Cryptobacteroides sp.]